MQNLQRLFAHFACICALSVLALAHDLRVFGTNPQITAMLELLYPQGLIGLNYAPYPEDRDFMPDGVATLPVLGMIGGGKMLSFEKLLSLKPDVVFFGEPLAQEIADSYKKLGIQVVTLKSHDLSHLSHNIQIIAATLPIESRARDLQEFIATTQSRLSALQEQITHRPKVYFALGIDGLQTQCADERHADLAYQIGGINALSCAQLSSSYTSINYEKLLALNPDIIFVRKIALYKKLLTNPPKQWQALKAVQTKQLFYAPSSPSNWLTKPPSVMQIIGIPWAFAKVQPTLLSQEEAQVIVFSFFEKFLRPLDVPSFERLQGLR